MRVLFYLEELFGRMVRAIILADQGEAPNINSVLANSSYKSIQIAGNADKLWYNPGGYWNDYPQTMSFKIYLAP